MIDIIVIIAVAVVLGLLAYKAISTVISLFTAAGVIVIGFVSMLISTLLSKPKNNKEDKQL